MKTNKLHLIAALTAVSSIASVGAQSTWKGDESSLWTEADNWTPSVVPGADATLVFNEVVNQTVNLEAGSRTVTLATFGSPDQYTLQNGTMDFNLPVNSGTTVLQQNGAGRILFNSNVAFSGNTSSSHVRITGVPGTGEIEFAGNVTRSNLNRLAIIGATVRFTGSTAKSFGSGQFFIGLNNLLDHGTLIVAMGNQTAQNTTLGSGIINLNNGTLEFAGLGATLANAVSVGSGNGVLKSAQTLTLNGNVTTGGSRTLVFDSGSASTVINGSVQNGNTSANTFTFNTLSNVLVSGLISNGPGALSFTKTGAATLTFSSNNTYTGATIVNGGTLLINGNQSTATGNVTVAANGTLGGSGTVGGATTINGLIAPGNSIGELTIANSLTFAPNGGYVWEISDWNGDTAGLDWDSITTSGANNLNITATSGSVFTIYVTEHNFSGFVEADRSFVIASAGGSILNFDVDKFVVNTDAFTHGMGLWSVDLIGNSLILNYSAIPEPRAALLFLLGGAAMLLHRARQRRFMT